MARILLLIPTTSYKTRSFLDAASELGVEIVVGCERRAALENETPGRTLTVDFAHPELAAERILAAARATPFDGVVGTDDESVLTAALASEKLGLRHNSPTSVRQTRDKYLTRVALREAGSRTPWFLRLEVAAGPERYLGKMQYPCVVKPLFLSGSRGVIRADGPAEYVAAFHRSASILSDRSGAERDGGDRGALLAEGYLYGTEVALEGILERGRLRTFALFDKPDTPDGPTFEETLLVTPSRLPDAVQCLVTEEVRSACEALGLTEGPVHAELRVHDGHPTLLEVAARTIGGLCSRMLRFATGTTLEAVVLKHLLGLPQDLGLPEAGAVGVFMIPVERPGRLRRVEGVARALAVAGVEDVALTVAEGTDVVPLPEGHQYLGFVFASGAGPAEVETALREARSRLEVVLD